MKKILLLLAMLQLVSTWTSRAYTLCWMWEDRFTQPIGTLPGQMSDTGPIWESAGTAGPAITVQAGNLAVANLYPPEGNRARLAGVNGPGARVAIGSNVVSGTLYYSLALRVAALGTLGANGGTLAAFNNATGATQNLPAPLAARLLVRSAAGGYQLGLSKSSTNGADFVWAPTTFSTTDVVFAVAAYEFKDGAEDVAYLWINPPAAEFGQSTPSTPTLNTSAGTDISSIQSFVLMQRPGPSHPALTFVDEIRVANMWPAATTPGMDFADAPEGAFPYPTTMIRNGARHGGGLGPLFFGVRKDLEADGNPTVPADGDDITGGPNDETGIVFGGAWVPGGSAWVDIAVSAAGRVDAWADWNQVAAWQPAEKIINNQPVPPGAPVRFTFTVPSGIPVGQTYARFRLSTAGGLTPVGFALDGAVQDYPVNILPAAVDFMVAANPAENLVSEGEPLTQTFIVSNRGPSTATSARLEVHFPPGATLDALTLSQGTGRMEGTNLVAQLGTLAPGASASVTFTSGTSNIFEGFEDEFWWYCGWIYATEIELNPVDNLHHGAIGVVALRDFSDAPDATVAAAYAYPTRLIDNGARHRIVGPYFGGSPAGLSNRDPDPDGLPTLNADGDDLLDANDDEEGIQFLDPIYAGATGVRVRINAPLGGRVDAWVDFNRNGRWSMGAPEQIFTSLAVAAGAFVYTFNVPAGAVTGPSYARFRISNAGGLAFTGYANNGEVHDLKLDIVPQPNPNEVDFNGLPHLALGSSQLSVASNLLSITTTGATGGLKVRVGDSDGYAAFIQGLDHVEAMNSVVQFSTYGNTNGSTNNNLLSSLRIEGHGSNATLAVDFSGLGVTQYQAFFYDGNARMVAAGNRGLAPGMSLYPCPPGTVWVRSVRYINGHWLIHFGCVRVLFLGSEVLDIAGVAVLELVPKVDPNAPEYINDYFVRHILVHLENLPGPFHLNDAVYKGSGLYSAAGDARLEINNSILATPSGSNSTGGLILHSGVSDLSSGQLSALFDENILYTASLGVTQYRDSYYDPGNSILLRAKLRLQPRGTTQENKLLAEFTASDSNLVQITTDFSALNAEQVLAEVYQGSNFVGRVTIPSGNIGTISGSNGVSEVGTVPGGSSGFAFSFDGPVTFTANGGPSFTGDKILCLASTTSTRDILKGLSVEISAGSMSGPLIGFSYDWGDAPAAALLLDARHYTGTYLRLGSLWDSEKKGYATDDCTGDDTHGSDDEDGVVVPTLTEGESTTIQVTTTGTIDGWLSIWIDLNNDGDFADDELGEYVYHWCGEGCVADDVISNITVDQHGTHDIRLYIPSGTVTTGGSAYRSMRVRLSDEPLYYNDCSRYSKHGECEDYRVKIIKPVNIDTGGLRYTSLGEAMLNLGTNGVQVSNLGSSGQDGVRMNLAGREGNVGASFTSLALDTVGSQVQFNLVAGLHAGRQSDAGVISLARISNGILLFGDMTGIGSAGFLLEVLNNGVLVSSTTVASSNVTGTITSVNRASLPGLQQLAVITDRPDGAVLYAAQFTGLGHFSFAGLEADGNELHLIALNPTRHIDNLARLEIRGGNVAGFTVQRVSTAMPALSLQMAARNGRPAIQWSQADALLEHADSVNGPWNTASNAMTGVTVDTASSQKFFRLVQTAARSELAKMLRQAELVFEGTVTGVEYHDSTPQSTNDTAIPHTFVTFAVNRLLKGSTTGGTLTLRFAGGMSADGRLLRVKSSTLFDVGERTILLVHGNEQYASPLIKWTGGRFRLVDGYAYTENGHELLSTQNGQLQIGSWHDLTEVRENDIAGRLLEIVHSTDETEEGEPVTPPASETVTEEAFRQFLLELIQRIHTNEELQGLAPVSSANAAQPFSVPNPVPRRVQ